MVYFLVRIIILFNIERPMIPVHTYMKISGGPIIPSFPLAPLSGCPRPWARIQLNSIGKAISSFFLVEFFQKSTGLGCEQPPIFEAFTWKPIYLPFSLRSPQLDQNIFARRGCAFPIYIYIYAGLSQWPILHAPPTEAGSKCCSLMCDSPKWLWASALVSVPEILQIYCIYHWIGLRENLNRKPWFLPSNIGLSWFFSHNPILWIYWLVLLDHLWDSDCVQINGFLQVLDGFRNETNLRDGVGARLNSKEKTVMSLDHRIKASCNAVYRFKV